MPAPSQWPPVPLHAVPLGAKFIPQLPATHVRVAQTESVPGQFDALTHCTQLPAPLQTPFGHGAPAGAGGLEHTPPVQTALMQGPLGGGQSAGELQPVGAQTPFVHTPPAHGVPSALGCIAHVPATQAAVAQGFVLAGQSAVLLQPPATQTPLLHVPPAHGVPFALITEPQVPLVQVAVAHGFVFGQSAAEWQPPPGVHVPLKQVPLTQTSPEQH